MQIAKKQGSKRSRLSGNGEIPFEHAILSPIYQQIHFTDQDKYRQFYAHLRNFTSPFTIYYDGWAEIPHPDEIDWHQPIPITFTVDAEEKRIVGCRAHLVFEGDWR